MRKNIKLIFNVICLLFISMGTHAKSTNYVGIDVSHHNGNINWEVVKRNTSIQFVYLKATEGRTYLDPKYRFNFKNAQKSGIKVGSYHFFRMSSGAHEQFQHFKNVVDKERQDLIPMIDVETTDKHSIKETRDSLRVLLQLIERYYGVKPMIYGTNRSYNEICGSWFNRYKLYLGRYGKNPPLIKGREHYLIWQYSEKGKIKGIPKPVDLCRFHPDYSIKDIQLKRNNNKIVGIDLSHHNKVDNWKKVSADFIYLKATEGTGWTDPKFKEYLKNARKYKIPVGAYHFMTTASSAEAQFKYYKSVVPKDKIDLIPVLDIERCSKGHPMNKKSLQRHVQTWCNLCKEYYGVYPILYCSREFYFKNFKGKFDYLLFWCGDVDASQTYVNKQRWTIWQQTIDSMYGIKGKVDINVLNKGVKLEKIKLQ